jgi:hypothetical protein
MEVSGEFHAPAALPPGEEPSVPLDRRLDGSQSRSGRGGEEEDTSPCRESNPGRPVLCLVIVLTELPRLLL